MSQTLTIVGWALASLLFLYIAARLVSRAILRSYKESQRRSYNDQDQASQG